LDEHRRATLRVDATVQPATVSDFSALGALVGAEVRNGVPYFVGLDFDADDPLWEEKLKALGAAMAATGAVALYHVAGATPEAIADPPAPYATLDRELPTFTVGDLEAGYAALSDEMTGIDLIWIGCPHASLAEIRQVADYVQGRRLAKPIWVTCARPVRDLAARLGLLDVIEAAGGHVFADACLAIAPVRELGFEAVATPSAKGAYYLRNLAHVAARFASFEECVQAAITGDLPGRSSA
jgi:predicted aconitase